MTLTRIIVVLVGALAIMMAIIILRSESTHQQYEISELERREDVLRQEFRREQLALQRVRNPAELLERVQKIRLSGAQPQDHRGKRAAGP
jgi:competence protein ComGF